MFKLKYISNKRDRLTNEFMTIEFGKYPYFASYGDMQNYEWDYTDNSDYGRVSDFRRGIREYVLPVVIARSGSASAINRLHEVIDYDVMNGVKGRLYYGDAYKEGWFYAGTPSAYKGTDHMIKIELKFITDASAWIKETSYTINAHDIIVGTETEGVNTFSDFPIDFNYDLVGGSSRIDVEINAYAYMKLIINGSATAPAVTIGDNVYSVDYAITDGERIEIDTRKKTVMYYDVNNRARNIFSFRDREHDIFAKLQNGSNIIETNGVFDIQLTVIEERSMAEWI